MSELTVNSPSGSSGVQMRWGTKVTLRDGIELSAILYLPRDQVTPLPAIVTLTPYVAQQWHDYAVYFASHGYPFVSVDVRGRGDSQGTFRPFIQEANDGYDVVEWLAVQPFCNGHVAMWGASYAGYDQWATAKTFPPHLCTIVPVAAPFIGVDMPMRGNIPWPYVMQWLTLVSGRTLQEKLFFNSRNFWGERFREWFESGSPFAQLDRFLGNPSATFQEWTSHPHESEYWDAYNPTGEQYAHLSIPVLTITGCYDADQPGALTHYRKHLQNASVARGRQHYLVIGPWDHFGTRSPRAEFCGIKVGPASLIDVQKLHRDWYAWVMRGAARPAFLEKNVAYYVMGAEEWRYADTLEEVTSRVQPFYLHSDGSATDVFSSGSLTPEPPLSGEPDSYVYDPSDVSLAELESALDSENRTDQSMAHAMRGRHLVYHSPPFEKSVELCGFFRLSAWLAIDQPDTDFRVSVHEIDLGGGSLTLSTDVMRARYRQSFRKPELIQDRGPLRYEFERFTFIAKRVVRGHRLRLIIGPVRSIHSQKNYNSGGIVAEESVKEARSVRVKLFHDTAHPSVLHVPLSAYED